MNWTTEHLFAEFLGHFSFVLTAIAYIMHDILLLRSLAVASGLVAILYLYLIKGPATILFWQLILLAINTFRILFILRERKNVSFTPEERELYQTVFKQFAPVEFMKIMRLGQWKTSNPGTILTVEGKPVHDLMLIYNGEVSIDKEGHELVHLRDGTMIGEISFLQGGNATATVRVVRQTRYVSWPQEGLQKMMRRNPTMDVAMKTVLSADLIGKLSEVPTV